MRSRLGPVDVDAHRAGQRPEHPWHGLQRKDVEHIVELELGFQVRASPVGAQPRQNPHERGGHRRHVAGSGSDAGQACESASHDIGDRDGTFVVVQEHRPRRGAEARAELGAEQCRGGLEVGLEGRSTVEAVPRTPYKSTTDKRKRKVVMSHGIVLFAALQERCDNETSCTSAGVNCDPSSEVHDAQSSQPSFWIPDPVG